MRRRKRTRFKRRNVPVLRDGPVQTVLLSAHVRKSLLVSAVRVVQMKMAWVYVFVTMVILEPIAPYVVRRPVVYMANVIHPQRWRAESKMN